MVARRLWLSIVCGLSSVALATAQQNAPNPPPVPPLPFGVTITSSSIRNGSLDNSMRYSLLRRDDVREELSIDAEQRRRFDALSQESAEALKTLLPVNLDRKTQTPEERQQEQAASQRRSELYQERIEKALESLYAEQRGRLEQLFLQQLGARALLRSDVADQIKITHAQMDLLKELQSARISSLIRPDGLPERPEDIRARMDKLQQEMKDRQARFDKEAPQVLTEEQRAAWDKLIGPKFEFRNPTRPIAAVPPVPPVPAKPEDPAP